MQKLEGHSDGVMAISFSPDGMQVVSGSDDETLRVSDAAAGVQLRILEGYNDRLSAIKYSLCGRYLVTDRGILYLDGSKAPADEADLTASSVQLFSKILIAADWLLLDGLNMLWLPPDIRPTCSVVHGYSITLGCLWGQVVFIEFGF